MAKDETQLLNVNKATFFLGVNANTIRRWAKTGKLKGVKVGTRGDWRFTKTELAKMIKEPEVKQTTKTYLHIKKFLRENAFSLQKLASKQHKELLATNKLRTEFLTKYQKIHSKFLTLLAANLEDTEKGLTVFRKLGEQFAIQAVNDGLSIEEAVDGTIFLKQAIWEKLEQSELLDTLSTHDLNRLSKIMAAYIDVLSSKIAFTYHNYYAQQVEKEKEDAKKVQDRLYNIFMQAPMPIAILKGADLVYELSNPQNNLGLGIDNPIGKSAKKLFPENKEILKLLEAVYKTGKPFYAHEYPLIITLPGIGKQTIYIDAAYQPLKDANNHVEAIMTTGFEVTKQVHYRQQAEETEKHLRFLSEADRILASSLDYKSTLQNIAKLAIPQIADWCTVDLLNDNGQPELVALAHKDPKQVKWAKEYRKKSPIDMQATTGLPNVLKTGKSEFYPEITDEMLAQAAKDEEELALARKLNLSSAIVVPISLGKITIGAISFLREGKRYYSKADLVVAEKLGNRAALAIENAQLYTEAQKAITLRNDFISLASHELKTPITSLKMYVQALARQFEKRGDTNLTPYFSKMDQQTDKLTLLVNDLLNVSRLQHGKLDFKMEVIDLNNAVKDTVDAVQETTKKHKIVVEGEITKKVTADQYRIYQVITNLLTNAIKYSPHADKIIVRLTHEKDAAVITVQDFGIGIEQDQQKKIFDQFYRVENPQEKTFPGLGMGLFIASEIIKRHGGIMSVVSQKGKGSQFSFTLPYNALEQNRTEQNRTEQNRKVKATFFNET